MNTVLVHYHLFKNAGTSFDKILKKNFGEQWQEKEFELGEGCFTNEISVREYLNSNPNIKALSSHTALLPPPILSDTEAFPVVFLRHPIVRLKSAYLFEKEQKADTYGAQLAKRCSFSEYIVERIGTKGDYSCRNFQSRRLSTLFPNPINADSDIQLRAVNATKILPFIGVVELFDLSVRLLSFLLEARGIEFISETAKENVTDTRALSTDKKILEIKQELGDEIFDLLSSANMIDLEVYELSKKLLRNSERRMKILQGMNFD
ncbi:sulfotransferase family 2 domain-containing protein [Roseibium alexandrii]|uniref:Sulfotransferase family protein n=1 Tax=Roseibium alexandrii TaxID=388408 RepID=A0A0M7API2_9HYPH|nr:sulfotransferase family 2 domain-containing protein [Roseibium alexandrii]CTQ75524.1 hypothetical protein LAX5112_04275 [Roseibium alexandrii]